MENLYLQLIINLLISIPLVHYIYKFYRSYIRTGKLFPNDTVLGNAMTDFSIYLSLVWVMFIIFGIFTIYSYGKTQDCVPSKVTASIFAVPFILCCLAPTILTILVPESPSSGNFNSKNKIIKHT